MKDKPATDTAAVSIVPFTAERQPQTQQLVERTLREFGSAYDLCADADIEDIAGHYREERKFWVALAGGSVIGTVAIDCSDGEAELRRMYLEPAWRGLGLGRLLLATALGGAKQEGCGAVRLDTVAEMTAARRLYEAAGFTEYEQAGDVRRYRLRLES